MLSRGVNLIEQESSGLRVSSILTQSVKMAVGVWGEGGGAAFIVIQKQLQRAIIRPSASFVM